MISLFSAAFLPDRFGAIGLTGRIVASPTRLPPRGAAITQINGRLVQDRIQPRPIGINDLCRDEGAAAAHAFRKERRVFMGYAGFGQRCNDTAGRRTHGSANSGRHQPARRNHRPETGDRHKAQPRQNARSAAETGTDAHALACGFGAIVNAVTIPVFLAEPIVRVVRDDADVRMRDAGGFQSLDGTFRIGI